MLKPSQRRGQSAHELLLVIAGYVVVIGVLSSFVMLRDRSNQVYRAQENLKLEMNSLTSLISKLKYENVTVEFRMECYPHEELSFLLPRTSQQLQMQLYDTRSAAWYASMNLSPAEYRRNFGIRYNVTRDFIYNICYTNCTEFARMVCVSNGYELCPTRNWAHCTGSEVVMTE